MEIERIETQWDDGVFELVEHLKAEIARAMAIPEYLMREPNAYAKAQREAWARTEVMRREVVRLINTHTRPLLVARVNGQQASRVSATSSDTTG